VVQLNILNGNKAGTEWVARRFPFSVGRSQQDTLALDDAGVWNKHCQIHLRAGTGAVLESSPDALTTVNGQTVKEVALRSGDIIELGSVKLRFGLSPTRQARLGFREVLTWMGLAALCLGQVAVIYWLSQ
jgi:pSer/pThr/pTyr-binding forkhead associated (FHA) protein